MKKLYYDSPHVEVIEVRVEQGFKVSIRTTADPFTESNPYFDIYDEGDMEEE